MTGAADSYAACEALVAQADRDRWLALLFAPADRRPHLLALAAYALEVARIREVVRDPMPGEIRLQWWIDVLAGEGRGSVAGHPVAAALIDTADRYALPRERLAAMAEARRFDLYDDPMPSLNDLEGYAGETASLLLQAFAQVLCDGDDPRSADAAGHGGVAYAMAGLMRALPITARRGQVFLPGDLLARHGTDAMAVRALDGDRLRGVLGEMRARAARHLEQATAALAQVDDRARPAFVGLGLVGPWLDRLAKCADPFDAPVDVPAWLKPWHLWRFARRLGASRITSGAVR